jgi:pre-mRNA-splicing factor SPF27
MLDAEMKRIEAGESLTPLDTIRYQLPGPTTAEPTDEDWKQALKNAHSQLEHQRLRCAPPFLPLARYMLNVYRQSNLALLQQYGANVWRVHNYRLEHEAASAEKELEYLRQRTTEVNRDRKNFQVYRPPPAHCPLHPADGAQERVGTELTSLEKRWTELISGALQIELANVALVGEIDRLNLREAELAGLSV